jgi:hypothetical protein
VMKRGPERVRALPHHVAAVVSHGLTKEGEKALKVTRSRNGCMGTWRRERAGEPQKWIIVPWMRAWTARSRDRRRKAGLESVTRVRGRKTRICVTVENLGTCQLARRGGSRDCGRPGCVGDCAPDEPRAGHSSRQSSRSQPRRERGARPAPGTAHAHGLRSDLLLLSVTRSRLCSLRFLHCSGPQGT